MCKAQSIVTLIIASYLSASRSSMPKIKVKSEVGQGLPMAAVVSKDKAFAVTGTVSGITGMSARDPAVEVTPAG